MSIRKIIANEDSYIRKVYSHEDIDTACFRELGKRPYRLGESKISKVNKIRDYIKGLEE